MEKFAKGIKANGEGMPFNNSWIRYLGNTADGYTDLRKYELNDEEEVK